MNDRKSNSRSRNITIWIVLIIFLLSILSYSTSTFSAAQVRSAPRQNNAPEAVIDSPENAATYEMGQIVHFDGSSSSDPDNDSLSYEWDFGDGETGAGVTATHVYSTPWVPIIRLDVSDGELNDTAYVVIVIGTGGGQNRPPTANIDSPNNFDTFTAGEPILFDGSGSSDPEEASLTYIWDFGDGNTSTGMVTMHTYENTNPYRVKLTVNDGVFNDSERIEIFVNNTAPIADGGGDKTGYLGQELVFDGSNSTDPDRFGNIVNYTWDLDNRDIKYGEIVTHTYDRHGVYEVILTVTDDGNATGSDKIKVTITNSPPIAVLMINSEDTTVNTDIEIDASGSYDIDGEVEEYYYIFGDSTETDWITDSVVEHRYYSLGKYDITLMVKDDARDISEPVNLTIHVVDQVNQPPNVVITIPNEAESVAGIVTVYGTGADQDGSVEQIEVKIDDDNWAEAVIVDAIEDHVDWEYVWDTKGVNDGDHIITARAYDGDKYSSEYSVMVKVNNRPTTYIDLTEQLKPNKCGPGEKVTVSGTAKYDTDVPVKNTPLDITIVETKKSWSTKTDEDGEYSYTITAPSKSGVYSITAYITDGTIEREISKKLTVSGQPDMVVESGDIKFSKARPKNGDNVNISVTIKNSGSSAGEGSVSIYQDSIEKSHLIGSQVVVNIPQGGSVLVAVTWKARTGSHEIIIKISDVTPAESDTDNNQASKKIVVSAAAVEDDDEKTQESLLDSFSNLTPMYKYAILGGIVLIIIIILVSAIAVKRRAAVKRKGQQETLSQTGGRVELDGGSGIAGTVVFTPLDKDKDKDKDEATKQVKRSMVPVVVIVFAILAIAMMGAAYTMPWYKMEAEASSTPVGDTDVEGNFYLTEYEVKDNINNITISVTWDKAEEKEMDVENTAGLYKIIQALTIISMLMCIILILAAILALFKGMKKIAVLFGCLAFIICLITPIYFMMQHPNALTADTDTDSDDEPEDGPETSFMGATEPDPDDPYLTKLSWGPAMGWYLAIVGCIFALLAFITTLAIPKPAGTTKPKQKPEQFGQVKFEEEPEPGPIVFKPLDEGQSLVEQKFELESRKEIEMVKFENVGD